MRKFLILLLITILLIPAIPSLAAGNEGIYEVTIYPNGRGMFRGTSDDLVIGDVRVSYDVDEEKNIINIDFDDYVFIDDVVSKGETIHKSIKFDKEENKIDINKPLDTSGYKSNYVESIDLEYEDVNKVDSITIVSLPLTTNVESEVSGNNWNVILTFPLLPSNRYDDIKIYGTGQINRFNVFYDEAGTWQHTELTLPFSANINWPSYKRARSIHFTNLDLNMYNTKITKIVLNNIVVFEGTLKFSDYIRTNIEVNDLNYEINDNNVFLNWKNPDDPDFSYLNIYRNEVLIESNYKNEIFYDNDLEVGTYDYMIETVDKNGVKSIGKTIKLKIETLPEKEVLDLDYTLQGNNITLSWINPQNDKFEGVKIYRDGEHIETTTEESFTETLPIGTYQYRITTLEAGEESEGITIDVSVQTIPTPVKGVNMINTSSTGGSITWEPNPKAQNISKYIVYVNGEKHGEIENPPYKLEDLEVGKKYDIAVSAVNDLGEGDRSDTVSYTPSKTEDLKSTIKVGEIFSYISMLFLKVWPLLALSLTFILFPHITNAIKSVVRSRSA